MAGVHAADGSINVTVVDGTANVGTTAPDGSINIIVSDGSNIGSHHTCGAFRVTVDGTGKVGRAPDGSAYVSVDGSGGYKVTVVGGSL